MPDLTPQTPQSSGWRPTGSTMQGGAGALLAVVVCGVAKSYGHPLDDMTAVSLGSLFTLAFNYFSTRGGRQ